MNSPIYRTAEFILYDVGFAGNYDEARWLVNNKHVFIDNELVEDPKEYRSYEDGKIYEIEVGFDSLYYTT